MLYLKCEKKKNKKLFNEKYWTNSSFNADDLILLYNIKLNNHYNMKFAFQWFEFYWIKKIIIIKSIYFFKEFNDISFNDTVFNNWIKCFYYQNFNLNSVLYTKETAFLFLILLIKKKLIVFLNQLLLNLTTSFI